MTCCQMRVSSNLADNSLYAAHDAKDTMNFKFVLSRPRLSRIFSHQWRRTRDCSPNCLRKRLPSVAVRMSRLPLTFYHAAPPRLPSTAVLRSHRLAFLVGLLFCFERTRARDPNKFIVVRVPLYDNPTVMPRFSHRQSRDALVAYAFRRTAN